MNNYALILKSKKRWHKQWKLIENYVEIKIKSVLSTPCQNAPSAFLSLILVRSHSPPSFAAVAILPRLLLLPLQKNTKTDNKTTNETEPMMMYIICFLAWSSVCVSAGYESVTTTGALVVTIVLLSGSQSSQTGSMLWILNSISGFPSWSTTPEPNVNDNCWQSASEQTNSWRLSDT